MLRRVVVCLLLAVLLHTGSIGAQQPKTVPRIGYVGAGSPATAGHHAQAFAQGLRELGYVEGQNIAIENRWPRESWTACPAS